MRGGSGVGSERWKDKTVPHADVGGPRAPPPRPQPPVVPPADLLPGRVDDAGEAREARRPPEGPTLQSPGTPSPPHHHLRFPGGDPSDEWKKRV